jgi:hypothetical protein
MNSILATGAVIETTKDLFLSDGTTKLKLIHLNNDTDTAVTVNVYIEYTDIIVRISKKDQEIAAKDQLIIEREYILADLNRLYIEVDTADSVSYIVQGRPVTDGVAILTDVREGLVAYFDERYVVGAQVDSTYGLTYYIVDNDELANYDYTDEVFFNSYFNFNVGSLNFYNCHFMGVTYIKNVGGDITFDNDCKGEITKTNASPAEFPEKITGMGGVNPDWF